MQSNSDPSHQFYPQQIKLLKKDPKTYHHLLKLFLIQFKTLPCHLQSLHNTDICFYYHSDNDKRRNPYLNHEFLYDPCTPCNCPLPNCPYFHNQFEAAYHPLQYKTIPCVNQINCDIGLFCPYTHPEDIPHFQYGEFFRFDLRTFKTLKCMNKHPHERKTCLYYHNDKDKRRPCHIEYNHFKCSKQKCTNDSCEYSHNKLEQLYHPNRYKTKFCQHYPNNIDQCQYKNFCSFAHTQNQIIQNIELIHLLEKNHDFYLYKYKTIWCPFTQNHERGECPYAHNIQDFRRNPKEYDYEPVRCQFWKFSDQVKSIEVAGCKLGMDCKKCHGWMEQRYHPLKYNAKSKSLKKQDFEVAQTIFNKKLPDFNFSSNDYKRKGKGNTNPQILKSNYNKGTPFFKSDKHSEYSAKTKARSNNFESDKSVDGSSMKDSKATDTKKINPTFYNIIFPYHPESESEAVNWESREARLSNEQKDQNSARSKSARKSDEYAATYSESLKSVFGVQNQVFEDEILHKLKRERFSEFQIVNMSQTTIDKLSFLDSEQKNILSRKLQIYNMRQINTISYSRDLTKYFISKKKDDLLEKLQQKRVKEAKLLKLGQNDINDMAYLEAEEKAILPKLLKEYRGFKEFKELSMCIEEQTKMK